MNCRCGTPMDQVSHRHAHCSACGRLYDVIGGQWREPTGICVAVTAEEVNETEFEFMGHRCRLLVIEPEVA